MFGGCGDSKDGTPQAFNDCHALDFSNPEMMKWDCPVIAGEKPAARARHTSTSMPDGRILIFGGLDRRKRFNDVWILDGKNRAWEKPVIQGEGPCPRAHHSATLVGNSIWIYGGYSGHGKLSSDMFLLDLGGEDITPDFNNPEGGKTPMCWKQPQIHGKGPGPRFDHCSTLFPGKFVIFGGQDNVEMKRDIHYMDVETMTWAEESGLSPQIYGFDLCNHYAGAIESVPNYKVFCIFGKTGLLEYSNDVQVMDVGNMQWEEPKVEGARPAPREDTAVAYDDKTCRLLFFGGWANHWLSDLWALNVSPIIGPPYACSHCSPLIGPVFGETLLTIKGIQFRNAGKIEVRFGHGKNAVISEGTFVDRNTITCMSPNFETQGAIEADIKVSISGEGWTVNKVAFSYFANTSAKNSIAFGPGLQRDKGMFGVEMPFLVSARDTTNAKRSSGGDTFVVSIKHTNDPKNQWGKSSSRVIDCDNGASL